MRILLTSNAKLTGTVPGNGQGLAGVFHRQPIRAFSHDDIHASFPLRKRSSIAKAFKYFNKYNVALNYYSIHKLTQDKVGDLLIAGDMAFLIRDDLALNHNAFPTKFAEYLASGVPVLTTPHLHSIASMVSKNNLGEVIETIKVSKNYDDLFDKIYGKYKNNFTIKNRCASFARSQLMWQEKAKEIFQIIDGI